MIRISTAGRGHSAPLGTHLCVLSAVTFALISGAATAAPALDRDHVPTVDAPASAYGPDVRTGTHGLPNMNDMAGIADRQRRAGYAATALHLATRVRQYSPDNLQARQTEISSLSNLGASDKALILSRVPASEIDAATRQRLVADVTASDIRHAIAEKKRLEQRDNYAHRFDALEQVLHTLDDNLRGLPAHSDAWVRTRQDKVYVLRELERMPVVIRAYNDLLADDISPLPYVQRAAADAYLAQRQPRRAHRLYSALIARSQYADTALLSADYYALIEDEQYVEAGEVASRLDSNIPVWRGLASGARAPNWERTDVDQLLIFDAMYRNHEALGETRAQTAYHNAPASPEFINALATVQRWRGHPQAAARTTALARAYAPRARDTRLGEANNARDLESYARWRQLIEPLARQFPNDSSVQRNAAELRDRRHPSIEGEVTYGRSDGGQVANSAKDIESRVRLSSPWVADNYRLYTEHYYNFGDFDAGDASFNRLGLGGEWRAGRKHAWATLSNEKLTGDDTGVQLGWDQWLNDRWHYQLLADTYSTQTPIRAHRDGYQGRLYQGQLDWRANESTSASFSAGALDISDGNLRSNYGVSLSQRIQASAHHQTRAIVSGDLMHNSQPGGSYYNPANAESVGVRFEHDWVTWRDYDRSLTQNFSLGSDAEWQTGQNGAAGIDARYEHSWQVSRTWSVHYGVGWGSHEYDGNREQRTYGVFGFSGVF